MSLRAISMKVISISLLFVLIEFSFAQLDTANYLIRPNITTPCPSTTLSYTQCLTLEQFVEDTIGKVRSNTTLNFLPGIHYLSKFFHVSRHNTFIMRAVSINVPPVINCNLVTIIMFQDITEVSIYNTVDSGE